MAKKTKKARVKRKVAAPRTISAEKAETVVKKPEANEGRIFGIIGIALAVLGIVMGIFGIAAIILGVIGIKKGDKNWGSAAIILGIVVLIVRAILVISAYSSFILP